MPKARWTVADVQQYREDLKPMLATALIGHDRIHNASMLQFNEVNLIQGTINAYEASRKMSLNFFADHEESFTDNEETEDFDMPEPPRNQIGSATSITYGEQNVDIVRGPSGLKTTLPDPDDSLLMPNRAKDRAQRDMPIDGCTEPPNGNAAALASGSGAIDNSQHSEDIMRSTGTAAGRPSGGKESKIETSPGSGRGMGLEAMAAEFGGGGQRQQTSPATTNLSAATSDPLLNTRTSLPTRSPGETSSAKKTPQKGPAQTEPLSPYGRSDRSMVGSKKTSSTKKRTPKLDNSSSATSPQPGSHSSDAASASVDHDGMNQAKVTTPTADTASVTGVPSRGREALHRPQPAPVAHPGFSVLIDSRGEGQTPLKTEGVTQAGAANNDPSSAVGGQVAQTTGSDEQSSGLRRTWHALVAWLSEKFRDVVGMRRGVRAEDDERGPGAP